MEIKHQIEILTCFKTIYTFKYQQDMTDFEYPPCLRYLNTADKIGCCNLSAALLKVNAADKWKDFGLSAIFRMHKSGERLSMNIHQKHQDLINEYIELGKKVARFEMYGFSMQVIVTVLLFSLKGLHVNHLYTYSAILFGLILLWRIRDFKLRRALDTNMSRIALDGRKLERQNPRLEGFFQTVLRNFNIIQVMFKRLLLDMGTLCFFAFAIFRLILDANPDFTMSRGVVYPLIGILGFFLGDLYYKPLKPLTIAKQESLITE